MSVWVIPAFFFFNDTATTEIYTLSLHDALPISAPSRRSCRCRCLGRFTSMAAGCPPATLIFTSPTRRCWFRRSEEHTSELQSHLNLVCRLLLEKQKTDRLAY